MLSFVVPNASCGCIIGRGGATIRNFADDSQAEIKLSSQEHMLPGVNERAAHHRWCKRQSSKRHSSCCNSTITEMGAMEELISRPSTYTIGWNANAVPAA